ncbi:MAG TPA: hypothetical protein VJY33_17765 [Isosphaeraceae bacterium]|nr:hypothetical protein [Isosphaeraceae bacterium]
MPYSRKIVLHCPNGYEPRLADLVKGFVRDGVVFVGVVGKDCTLVEDVIDELVAGLCESDSGMLTSSYPNERITEVVEFARDLTDEYQGEVQVIEL